MNNGAGNVSRTIIQTYIIIIIRIKFPILKMKTTNQFIWNNGNRQHDKTNTDFDY